MAAGITGGTDPGALTYDPAIGAQLDAGTHMLTVEAAQTLNYKAATASVAILVTKASLTVQADHKAKTYDGLEFTDFTASYNGFVAGEDQTALDGAIAFGGDAVGAVNAGEYTITVSGLSSGNYVIAFEPGTLAIGQAEADVIVSGVTVTYNGGPHGATGSARGADGSDLTALLDLGASFTAVPGGTAYWSFAGDNNHIAASGSVNIVIEPAPLEVTIHGPASGLLVQVNEPVDLSGSFTLTGVPGTYSAGWAFSSATVAEYLEHTDTISGTAVSHQTTFTEPGVYAIELIVIDPTEPDGVIATANTVEPDDLLAYIVVYDPEGGFVTGGGWINSPAGAVISELAGVAEAEGRATFGFVSRDKKGATVPTGNTQFQFRAGNLDFKSTEYEWMVVSGARAQYKGSGILNGEDSYSFMLTCVDGSELGQGHPDRFRIKIKDDLLDEVIYDNMLEADDNDELDDSTIIGGGSIVIHTPPAGR